MAAAVETKPLSLNNPILSTEEILTLLSDLKSKESKKGSEEDDVISEVITEAVIEENKEKPGEFKMTMEASVFKGRCLDTSTSAKLQDYILRDSK